MSNLALKGWRALALALALVFSSSPTPGQSTRLEGVTVRIQDEGPGEATPLERPLPGYPETALARAIDGWVALEFTIGVDGTVTQASVEKASNPVFESGALEAVRRWVFESPVRDEKPVPLPGQRVTLEFTLSDEAKRALEYAAATGGASSFQGGNRQNRKSLSMHREGERFMKALGECLEYYQNQQFEKARESLASLRMRSLNPIERAKTYRMYAYL
ncbi:MAG: energy transducer TonB, partial [Myxococcota bacterium]|nr:energy transducer TonB [Myxococcota bacterium]